MTVTGFPSRTIDLTDDAAISGKASLPESVVEHGRPRRAMKRLSDSSKNRPTCGLTPSSGKNVCVTGTPVSRSGSPLPVRRMSPGA